MITTLLPIFHCPGGIYREDLEVCRQYGVGRDRGILVFLERRGAEEWRCCEF